MSARAPGSWGRGGGFGGGFGGLSGRPPQDVIVLVAIVFATWSLQFFRGPEVLMSWLRLGPGIFQGRLWQLATYPFVGAGGVSLWILLELLILYMFAKDVFWALGRRRFWRTLVIASVVAAGAAVVVQLVMSLAGTPAFVPFGLMQGQRELLVVLIAAFATLYGNATILLFFVLPVKARWFLWLEILFAFVMYLGSGVLGGGGKDLAGFVGLCTSVGVTYLLLSPGGPQRELHNLRKRLEAKIIEWRLARLRRKRKFDIIDGDGGPGRDRWIN